MKKMLSVILMILWVGVLGLALVGCQRYKHYPEFESGYYRYAVKTERGGTKKAYLVGLTESGAEQTALVYPEEIDGIPVYGIGYQINFVTIGEGVGHFESNHVEKLFFPTMPKEKVSISVDGIMYLYNDAYVVYWNLVKGCRMSEAKGAIFGYNYIEEGIWVQDYDALIGNVSYLYNYDDAPNKNYYWVDSYDESLISFIPPEPERAGYRFDGWYKEPECVNEWSFETDVTGKEIVYVRYGLDSYDGIYLYAKWIKNKNQ